MGRQTPAQKNTDLKHIRKGEYSEWQKVEYVFDNDSYAYVQVKFRWLENHWAFDNFQLYEIDEELLPIDWEMTSAGWGTLILPFAADVPDGLTLYAGDQLTLDEDGTTITVGTAAETIAANTPYLVKGDAATYTFTGTPEEATTLTSGMLTGTFDEMDYDALIALSGTVYLLQNHDGENEDGVAFYPVAETESADATLTPYHCYLNTGTAVTALHLPGMSTGIVAVEGAETLANDAIYDLSGRRVSKAVKGVYIQNGKKVLVK